MNNKYVKCSKFSEREFRALIHYFSIDLTATQASYCLPASRQTINKYYKAIRLRIVEICDAESPVNGEIEVDESYFGARRVRGKRGRGAYGKTIVFGLIKRQGKVYTEIVPNCQKDTLQGIIRGRVELDSVIYSDGWRGYSGLVDVGYSKHLRVDHGKNEFVRGKSHVNGIESFWGYAKIRLVKFRGVSKTLFNLHLKECEFRFNYRHENIGRLLLKSCRKTPLKLS